jgi:hypothetical protein
MQMARRAGTMLPGELRDGRGNGSCRGLSVARQVRDSRGDVAVRSHRAVGPRANDRQAAAGRFSGLRIGFSTANGRKPCDGSRISERSA